MSKVSLSAQIADARRELDQRRTCDASGIARVKPRRAEGQLSVEVQQAILRSLEFLQQHEEGIRAYIASKQGAAK